jgi:hypothetical protein
MTNLMKKKNQLVSKKWEQFRWSKQKFSLKIIKSFFYKKTERYSMKETNRAFRVSLGFHWGFIEVSLGFHWGFIRFDWSFIQVWLGFRWSLIGVWLGFNWVSLGFY